MAQDAGSAAALATSNNPNNFVHLHVHTHYSMLDGACKVGPLVARAKELGMPAISITDHGVMYGAVEFYNECKKVGIKPIIGVEAYMAPGDRRDRSTPGGSAGEAAYHLLLLAQDLEGYRNLMRLSKISFMEGFYYKPRIDKETLKEFSKGIICTSSCLGGEVANTLLKKDAKLSRKAAETYLEIFGPDRFFIEVQKHIKEQDQVNPELAELADKLGVGLVGTNDVHFLKKDDYHAHNCLCCISTGKLADDPNRMIYPPELYLKSPAEMAEALKGFPNAMSNTLRIAEMCNLELDFSKRYAPVYRVPPDKLRDDLPLPSAPRPKDQLKDDERYLRELCETGLDWRYGTRDVPADVRTRLEYELKIICMKNFCSYFLIVWDFCNYARDHGIPVGARGSGVGTMVGYLLGLCNVDPLKYSLLFERFMDPSRNEMPDIDIDICQDGRPGVIEYVRKKYGHVAQIVTFGTLAAKAACKDVARVLGIDIAVSTKLTGLIPGVPGMTIDKALQQVPELREMVGADPKLQQLIETAKKLEGLCRNAGVHAAGVIIADQPLDELIPLCKDKEGNVLTQFEGPIAEKCGMLKMDFLGLRTLSVITRAVKLAKSTGRLSRDFDVEKVDITDKKVLDLFGRGETKGVFQFESGGMQDLLMKMQPDRLEDLIAANALYRPGPMELIPAYCNRKHKREPVPNVHPIMDAILSETYGIMCIHEDTRIALADGREKAIKDVRGGDVMHSLNPATNQFEARECHGCGPTRFGDGLKLTLENGYSVTLTPDHKVLTFGGYKEAQHLDPATDVIAVGLDVPQHRPSARHVAPWLGDDEAVAYLIGTLIGDGCLTASGCTIATGREADHRILCRWMKEQLPTLRQHEYFHGRSWYLSLSDPTLLNDPARGNRKTRFHHFLDTLGIKCGARDKRVPEVLFRTSNDVRAALLAGLLDSDGCTAVTDRGAGVCFVTSVSRHLLQDIRRLSQLSGIPTTIRPQRIQFWNLRALRDLVEPYCLVRRFEGKLNEGTSVGWVPRDVVSEIAQQDVSIRAFSRRTGIQRGGLAHDLPFVKTSTAVKAGINLGAVRYHRIAQVEPVKDQQFYGMSVEQHHNLLANGIVIKNCYQEQVMQVFNQLGGIDLANAYKLIKAISKKTTDVIAKFKPEFIKGTMDKGVSEAKATEIFDLILKFGGYGFNKSHSTRYAFVAFQTGYLKTYHPVEYQAALLTYEMGDTTKMIDYIDECRRMKIRVLPPNVNQSGADFTPVYEKVKGKGNLKEGFIRFGMAAVRGVGEKAVETIIAERDKNGPFTSIYDFCERIDTRAVQKSTLDALIRCGAFDDIHDSRAAMLHALDPAFESAQRAQQDKASGQGALFGGGAEAAATPAAPAAVALPKVPEFTRPELLQMEKDLLGIYVSSHPLTERQSDVEAFGQNTTKQTANLGEGTVVKIAAMISAIRKRVGKSGRSEGKTWAILEFEDLEGKIEGMCFADLYESLTARDPTLIKTDRVVIVEGTVDRKREAPALIVRDIMPIEEAAQKMTTHVVAKLEAGTHTPEQIDTMKGLIKKFRGGVEVGVIINAANGKVAKLTLGREVRVRPAPEFVKEFEDAFGRGTIELIGPGSRRKKMLEQQRLFAERQRAEAADTELTAATPLLEPAELDEVEV